MASSSAPEEGSTGWDGAGGGCGSGAGPGQGSWKAEAQAAGAMHKTACCVTAAADPPCPFPLPETTHLLHVEVVTELLGHIWRGGALMYCAILELLDGAGAMLGGRH